MPSSRASSTSQPDRSTRSYASRPCLEAGKSGDFSGIAQLRPGNILAVGMEDSEWEFRDIGGDHRSRHGATVAPLSNLGMSVGESEPTTAAVSSPRAVLPERDPPLIIHSHGEGRIIYAVGVLINEHPQIRR